jgi:hypothetical protein
MAERPVTRITVLIVALALVLTGLAGCGDEDNPAFSKDVKQQMDSASASRRAKVESLVDRGKLPQVALRVLHSDGTLNVNFIDGPSYDRDVVHTGPDGISGKKLVWDLNHDGKISRSERTITERDLYDATLGVN